MRYLKMAKPPRPSRTERPVLAAAADHSGG